MRIVSFFFSFILISTVVAQTKKASSVGALTESFDLLSAQKESP